MSGRPGAERVVELPEVPPLSRAYARAVAGGWRRVGIGPHPSITPCPPPTLVVRGVRADPARLAAYQHLVGEPGTDVLPAGFVHVVTFGLSMAVLTDDAFPLPAPGLVHVANHVVQHRPVRLDETLDLRCWASPARPHRRGTAVDLCAQVRVGHDLVWTGTSTCLARSRHRTSTDPRPDHPTTGSGTPTGQWRVAADEGRRYAAVSGDRNPIHLSRVAARLFGFRAPIMHGMDSAARLLAAAAALRGDAFEWSVDFVSPIVLPATVAVRVAPAPGDEVALAAWRPQDARPHVTGTIQPR